MAKGKLQLAGGAGEPVEERAQQMPPQQQLFWERLAAAEKAHREWQELAKRGLPEDIKAQMAVMRAADKFENAYTLLRETPGGTFYTTKEGEMNYDRTPQAIALQARKEKIGKKYAEMLALEITWRVPHEAGAFSRESFLMEKIQELPAEQRMALEAEMFFTKENLERIEATPKGDMSRELACLMYQRTMDAIRKGTIKRADLPLETSNAMHEFSTSRTFIELARNEQAREEFKKSLESWKTATEVYLAVHQTIFPFSYAATVDVAKKGGFAKADALDWAKFVGASTLEAVLWAPVIRVVGKVGSVSWAAIQVARQEGLREALKRVVPAAAQAGKTAVEAVKKMGWTGATVRTALYGVLYATALDDMIEVMSSDPSTRLEKAQAALNFARTIALTEGIMYYGGKLSAALGATQLRIRCVERFIRSRLLKTIGKTIPARAREGFERLIKKVAEQIAKGEWKQAVEAIKAFGKKHGIEPLEKMTETLAKELFKPMITKLLGFAAEMTAFTLIAWQALDTGVAMLEYAAFCKKPGDTARYMQVEGKEMQERGGTLNVVRGVTVETGGEMLEGIGIGPEFAEAISEAEYVELRRRIPRMTAEEIKETFEEYRQLSDEVKKDVSFAAYLAAKSISPELQTQIAELHETFESVLEEERGSVVAASFRDVAHTPFERFILTATTLARAETNAEAKRVIDEYAQLERTDKKFARQMTLSEYTALREGLEKEEVLTLAREYAKLDEKTKEQVKLSGYIRIVSGDSEVTNEQLHEAVVEFAAIKEREPIERGLIGDRILTEFETATLAMAGTKLEEEAQRLEGLLTGLEETGGGARN